MLTALYPQCYPRDDLQGGARTCALIAFWLCVPLIGFMIVGSVFLGLLHDLRTPALASSPYNGPVSAS